MTDKKNEHGAILLIVLWVLVVLSVLAFGFASNVQMGARAVRNAKDGTIGYFLTKAAINETIFELESIFAPGIDPQVLASFKQRQVSRQPVKFDLKTGTAECWIENEAGKLDLNSGSPVMLRNLLVHQFDLSDSDADNLVNQWTNWVKATPDSTTGVVRGGPLLAVESMMQFSGMKPEYVYGFWKPKREGGVEHRRGLMELTTVYTNFSQINLNDAPEEVLQAIPGVDASEVQAIINARTQHFFESIDDCQRRVPMQFNDAARNLVTVEEAPTYTLVARGRAAGSDYDRTVRAIVRLGVNQPLRYQILYWKDEEI
jgi:type II secretory pathway component PulK